VDGDGEFEGTPEGPPRCPDDCPNAGAPYCPAHEDPAIYRRDETKLHLAEAYANNAARDMIVKAVESQRQRRRIAEVRVPGRVMDEWIVFTKKVVLDSGEYTAQGEIERRVSAWLDKAREQDWARLDRIKERYLRFTTGPDGKPLLAESAPRESTSGGPGGRQGAKTLKRPRPGSGYGEGDYGDEEF
jgi:hypothetical protein